MRHRLKILFLVTLLMSAALAVYCFRTGKHKLSTLVFRDGATIEIRADNIPSEIHLWRHSIFGRRIVISTNSNLNTVNGEKVTDEYGSFSTSFVIPESSYSNLEFQIVACEDDRYYGMFEKQFPDSLLLLYDSKNKEIVSTFCSSSACYRGPCLNFRAESESEILKNLNAANRKPSEPRLKLHRCGSKWHHSPRQLLDIKLKPNPNR